MRNLFRRQTKTPAPSLRDRSEALREGLSRRDAVLGAAVAATVPLPTLAAPQPVERADLYDRLLILFAEDCAARRVKGDRDLMRAAQLVAGRLWKTAREVTAMPPPKTLEGLKATALAAAIIYEGELCGGGDMAAVAAVGVTRAALAITGTPLPADYSGFGDEPGFHEREIGIYSRPGAVPAWAIAEIEAEDAADA